MVDNLESAIWRLAAQRYGDELSGIVTDALSGYKRAPGFDGNTRLHLNDLGPEAFGCLLSGLIEHVRDVEARDGYVCIREALRGHLRDHLLWRLIRDGWATGAMRDGAFSQDLGI